jgi:WhiB family transcriptional regulator, redox-sensing transcriptional regulator
VSDIVIDDAPGVPLYELLFQPEPWREQAACKGVDPNLFFPGSGGVTDEAKRVCATCPVAGECLDYSLRTCQKLGIWGGTSESERRKLRRGIREIRGPVPCGTVAGWARHKRRNEDVCDECRTAYNAKQKAYRQARMGAA